MELLSNLKFIELWNQEKCTEWIGQMVFRW